MTTTPATQPVPAAPDDAPQRPRTGLLRRVACVVVAVLAVVVTILAVPATYAKDNVLDTRGYLEIVQPLADDPEVQVAVSEAVTAQVMEQVPVDDVVEGALSDLAGREVVPDRITNLAPILENQVEQLVRATTDRIVTSDQFAAIWTVANRAGHGAFVTALEGREGAVVDLDTEGSVTLSTGPILEKVRDALLDRGFTAAQDVDVTGRTIVLFQSDDLATAQRAYAVAQHVVAILPWLALVLVAGAVALAAPGRRLRALAWIAGVVALVMAALQIGIALTQSVALGTLPPGAIAADAAAVIADAFLAPLRVDVWWVFGIAVVVLVVSLAAPPLVARLRASRLAEPAAA
ncbi:hypothetical protein CLV28_2685 [Sediminihabitans luteus]|uniref:Integral membrane protein n=1 Tax=Sediminihabitans luteus TaxID=1138585 RepID=A0A2M9CCV5_9CELL|nr:hypothetical protein [Sediminihabitans luteus]PJJ69222.1 hypothetical protein CLV28_2685 [Sediminihabitans luteus]GII98898.1 hypothetical protein Slu03_12760 [Sediminihabitans luteus]